MRAEANDGDPLVAVGRDRRVDVAMLVKVGVSEPHRLQLVRQQAAQILLLFGGGAGRGGGVGLGVDHHIAQKALGHGMREPKGCIHSQNRAKRT